MSVDEFGEATVGEIEALTVGYQRRRENLEDLFIIYSALPTYQGAYGKKAPTYKKLTEHRRHNRVTADIDNETVEYWRKVLEEARNAEK